MIASFLLSAALLSTALAAGDQPPAAPDLQAYREATATAGRDAEAQVKLALWCEAHGLTAERIKHLTLATLIDPSHAAARGLLGLIFYQGKWQRPDDVGHELRDDPARKELLKEYMDRRVKTPDKPGAQWKLAQWCEQRGLSEQAAAHYHAVTRLDSRRDAAWKKLGFKKSGERWLNPEELTAEKANAERQKAADRQWKTRLTRLRDGLSSKDATRRADAEKALTEVTDPRAVPMVWQVLFRGDDRAQGKAVQVLGQIDSPAASMALASLALISRSPEVRGRATETLMRRDPRDFLTPLLTKIRKPFDYKVRPVNGPGSEGVLFVEGERYNVQRLYQVQPFDPSTLPPRIFRQDVPFDPFSVPNLLVAAGAWGGMRVMPSFAQPQAQQLGREIAAHPGQAAALARQGAASSAGASPAYVANLALATQAMALQRDLQIATQILGAAQNSQAAAQSLQQDIQSVETINAGIRETNDRVLPLVKQVTGQDFGTDTKTWMTWWTNELGYAYQSEQPTVKPTYTDAVVFDYQAPPPHGACFAAGTQVHTIEGLRPIEGLRVGDQVLSQNTSTGALSFRPIVAVHHNAPSSTLKLSLGDEPIIATGIHRFWIAGKGWTMARDLRTGQMVRTVGGIARVEAVQTGTVQQVYNLDVADNRNFFVGKRGFLVYDFSFVQPVETPFDRQRDLASLATKTR